MGKNKVDLLDLLAKYQKNGVDQQNFNGVSQGNFNSSRQQNFNQSRRQNQIQQDFYGKRTFNGQNKNSRSNYKIIQNYEIQLDNHHDIRSQTSKQPFIGNFKMSKQQCESFLLQIRNQLKKQRTHLSMHSQSVLKQITERFSRSHQKIRRQILELLDQAFRQNQKALKEQLFKQSKYEPAEFTKVYHQIGDIDNQIEGFITQLRGLEYKKAISAVVLKDYKFQIQRLRINIKDAKDQYLEGLGQVQPDRTRIDCLKNDLNHLFYFKKKNAKVIEKSIFSVLGGQNTQLSPNRYNQSKFDTVQQQASRTRKSFFNFGN